ncbi:MAG: hypothetical protein V1849_05060, partial [Chloroflexota bacterium]
QCLFCHTRMNLNLGMSALVSFEPPDKVITSGAITLVTYICNSCGFVALFESSVMKKVMAKIS